ncbi:MAG TPA: VOC family protein [Xanthobacteraceae bacterium]|jgi:predicted 3-demethylubiquinone-9 3-methyltransferase (glyoxalase superfamily)|nr:VOC family protein [Xanthobacteraceae bacterium]
MSVRRQKITPFLWFNTGAEEAINHYISVFKDGKLLDVSRYTDLGPGPKGTVMTATFELAGQRFIALNGGPHFKFNEAISLFIDCQDQAEVDHYWEKLSEGGSKSHCGWLKDKYGLSWQVVPKQLMEMATSGNAEKTGRMMGAMMKMQKLDIAELEAAYNG